MLTFLAILSVALRFTPTGHVVAHETTAASSNCLRVRAKLRQDLHQRTPFRLGLFLCDLVKAERFFGNYPSIRFYKELPLDSRLAWGAE